MVLKFTNLQDKQSLGELAKEPHLVVLLWLLLVAGISSFFSRTFLCDSWLRCLSLLIGLLPICKDMNLKFMRKLFKELSAVTGYCTQSEIFNIKKKIHLVRLEFWLHFLYLMTPTQKTQRALRLIYPKQCDGGKNINARRTLCFKKNISIICQLSRG